MPLVTPMPPHYWRNSFDAHPVMAATVDRGALETLRPLRLAPAMAARLGRLVPDLPDGAVAADWPTLSAALCLALHRACYSVPPSSGVLPDGDGFWFAMRDPFHARKLAAEAGAFLAWALRSVRDDADTFGRAFAIFEDRTAPSALDQSVRAVIAEAERRGIPWRRTAAWSRVVSFGQGHLLRHQFETQVATQAAMGTTMAHDKALSFQILHSIGIPVGSFALATTAESAARMAEAMGFPVVVKPNTGSKGTGVRVGLVDGGQVTAAAEAILATGIAAVVQSVLPGDDHRLLVVDGQLVAAARREPAAVTGDGVLSVEALIAQANRDPRRAVGFRGLMNMIVVDDEVRRVLEAQSLDLKSVPEAGRRVLLRRTANIATGGTATDFTTTIHPDNRRLAERAARALGLKLAGVDFLTPDITRSWREVGGGVCEVNTTVGLRPHWLANPSQNVVSPILDLVYPRGNDGRVPTALVTGTNGKTTTTRMLAQILRAAGNTVGCVTTDGVQVDDEWIARGDLAGLPGAEMVLQDPSITAAVLETARGGILKHGIYLEQCDVAALLNVAHEQVGMDGIATLEEMGRLKRKVLETARRGFVLNADDPQCQAMLPEFDRGKTIVFSPDPASPAGRAHIAAGGTLVTVIDDAVTIVTSTAAPQPVIGVAAIPATANGRIGVNVDNALAATGLAHAMGVDPAVIAAGLRVFTADPAKSPGRFNRFSNYPVDVLIDFANNPPALERAMSALTAMQPAGQTVIVFSSPGNRSDEQIRDCARAVAGHGRRYVCMERQDKRRGRAAGEIAALLSTALVEAGVPADGVSIALTQEEAIRLGAGCAREPGDLLAIFYTEVAESLAQLNAVFGPAEITVGQ